MPASWGTLLALQATTSKSALTLSPNIDPALSTAPPPGAPGGDGGRVQLGAGAWAGIAIGCAVVVGLLGFVIERGLRMNKEQDRDKDAQLAYMNEMTEGDIKAQDEEDGRTKTTTGVSGLPWLT